MKRKIKLLLLSCVLLLGACSSDNPKTMTAEEVGSYIENYQMSYVSPGNKRYDHVKVEYIENTNVLIAYVELDNNEYLVFTIPINDNVYVVESGTYTMYLINGKVILERE